MISIPTAFSGSYAEARVKFLEAAATAGLNVQSHAHPLKGRDGEDLAMDVARDGALDAENLLIISSACHGVEGYGGSGVQVSALHDSDWLEKARASGTAVLYIHTLNPYGFSHLRRTTHENVDLNRNFQDFTKPLPDNAACPCAAFIDPARTVAARRSQPGRYARLHCQKRRGSLPVCHHPRATRIYRRLVLRRQ